jgi:hypothetical protein
MGDDGDDGGDDDDDDEMTWCEWLASKKIDQERRK